LYFLYAKRAMPTAAMTPAMPNCPTRSEMAPEAAPELLVGELALEEPLEELGDEGEDAPEEPDVGDGALPLDPLEAAEVGAPAAVEPALAETVPFRQLVCPD